MLYFVEIASMLRISKSSIRNHFQMAQSDGAAEYTDCISIEG